jgi:outer membrane protein OmpA-like peptidoglycan-associated protein|tara:strand:- start:27 stop:719 length:693 start_codon:yes stop_codon:yes gene_type:complete
VKKSDNSYWISIADLMTGLMVVFLFIAINYVIQVFQYRYVSDEIYNALVTELDEEVKDGDVQITPDGTVRFSTEGDRTLFELGEYTMSQEMKETLDWFIPRYFDIVSNPEYLKYIKEIRIEGHTDTIPPKSGADSYSFNLWLSSMRAIEVLSYVRNSDAYSNLNSSQKERFDYVLTATGMSYSKALNSDGEYVYESDDKRISPAISRRVEFRAITSSDKVIEEIFSISSE